MENLEVKESSVMLEEAFQLLATEYSEETIKKYVDNSRIYYILFCDEVIACSLFDDEETYFLVVKKDFRCCGLGTKILNKLRTRYARASSNLKISLLFFALSFFAQSILLIVVSIFKLKLIFSPNKYVKS